MAGPIQRLLSRFVGPRSRGQLPMPGAGRDCRVQSAVPERAPGRQADPPASRGSRRSLVSESGRLVIEPAALRTAARVMEILGLDASHRCRGSEQGQCVPGTGAGGAPPSRRGYPRRGRSAISDQGGGWRRSGVAVGGDRSRRGDSDRPICAMPPADPNAECDIRFWI